MQGTPLEQESKSIF